MGKLLFALPSYVKKGADGSPNLMIAGTDPATGPWNFHCPNAALFHVGT